MKYSIVIPAYNIEKYITRTLESALAQTQPADEIIIIDDGSNDNTGKTIKSYISEKDRKNKIKYHFQKNAGAAAARNRGVELAKSDWILFLDGDDLYLPERIELLDQFLTSKQNEKLVMVAGNEFEGNDEQGWVYKNLSAHYKPNVPLFEQLFRGCFLSTSSMAVKRPAYLACRGMDVNLRSAQDYDLWLRLAEFGELGFINKPLSKYTLRPENISSNPVNRYSCLLIIFQKHFDKVSSYQAIKRYTLLHYEVFHISVTLKKYLFAFKVLMLALWNVKIFFTKQNKSQ